MHFPEKTIRLKDGRTCLLRPVQPEDAIDMIEFLRTVSGETPYLLRNANEVTFTQEAEEELLARKLGAENEFMMLASIDGVAAANCGISAKGFVRRQRHRCGFAIALREEYWHLGLGSAMLDYSLALARQIGYEQVELEVVEGNDRAKALYERFGFQATGTNVRALKYDDGSYRDETIMIKQF